MNERTCTAHAHEPIEAEWVLSGPTNIPHLMLRCPVCDRPRGLRYVVKSERPSNIVIGERPS